MTPGTLSCQPSAALMVFHVPHPFRKEVNMHRVTMLSLKELPDRSLVRWLLTCTLALCYDRLWSFHDLSL